MYQPNYGYQYPYYGTQPPIPDNLAQLRMNTNQMQNNVVQPSMASPPMQVQPAQQSSQIIWVSGEAGAKSYLVAPGNTVSVVTPAAIGDQWVINFETLIELPCGCCDTISVRNISATTAIEVENANILFERIA